MIYEDGIQSRQILHANSKLQREHTMTPSNVEQAIASQIVASQVVTAPHNVVQPMLIVDEHKPITERNDAAPLQPRFIRPGEGTLWHAFGDSIRAQLTPEDTGGEIFVGHMEPPAGYGPPLHVHTQEDEIFIVEQGTFEFTIRDEVFPVEPGTVVYGPRNIPHTWRATGEEVNRATVISVPGCFGRFFKRCADVFAKGEPDMAEIFRIAGEHELIFMAPEEAAVYPVQDSRATPQPRIIQPNEGIYAGVPGERGRGVLMNAETGGQCLLAEIEIDPGHGPAPHIHTREDEVFLIQSGRIEFQIGNERTEVGPGAVVFAPRNIAHTFRVVSEEPARAFILVTPGDFEQFFVRRAELWHAGKLGPEQMAELSAEFGLHFLAED